METKKCNKYGRELPLSEFYKSSNTKDGLQRHCKDCAREYVKNKKIHKVYSNPELAKYTPRELMEELRSRGYTGELKFVQVISL